MRPPWCWWVCPLPWAFVSLCLGVGVHPPLTFVFICPKLSAYSSPFFCCFLRARSVDFGSHALVSTVLSLLVSSLLLGMGDFGSYVFVAQTNCYFFFLLFVTYDSHVVFYVGALCLSFIYQAAVIVLIFYVLPSCETVGEEMFAQNWRPGRALLKTALDCPDSPSS